MSNYQESIFVVLLCWYLVIQVKCGVPQPIITLHDGHIGLYDSLMETEYTGSIVAGQPYTLDIYMGNTDQYDYVIEQCMYNQRVPFMDQFGCLQRNNIFQQKWETDQYTNPGSMKRTLVHLTPEETVLSFECQIKVIECCGCAEQYCERRPVLAGYPTYPVPLTCCNTIIPPPIVTHQVGWTSDQRHWWFFIPWWLWLLLLILLLLLLTCLVCAVGWLLFRRRNKVHSEISNKTVITKPEEPIKTVAAPAIYRVDRVAQTLPEQRQVAQQVDMDRDFGQTREYPYQHRQAEDHATISLHGIGRGESGNEAYAKRRHEDGRQSTVFHPFNHPARYNTTDRWEECEEWNEVIDTAHYENYPPRESTTKRTRFVPNSYSRDLEERHNRLQRELQDNLRRPRSRSHEIYTNQVDEDDETTERYDKETIREETVRTVRQSSFI
ncbi:Patterned Expression Site [Ditylenchus destructor]|uniref:Patterned Expression Site n=1 Tax=Ditylenchus destructor TaxID=166010 RepID=A0AAD4NBY1_9BILA|nr:Patterned Expression Site [Ditylenchus destructor]